MHGPALVVTQRGQSVYLHTHEDLKKIVPKISLDVMKNLDLRNSVNSKKSYGGTSFENIKKMIRKHKKEIK